MARPVTFDEFLAMGAAAMESGTFPNGYRSGPDHVAFEGPMNRPRPATQATANNQATANTQATANPPPQSSGINTNVGLQSNQQAGPSLSGRSDHDSANAASGQNAGLSHTNTLATGSTHRSSNPARNNGMNDSERWTGESGLGPGDCDISESDDAEFFYAQSSSDDAETVYAQSSSGDAETESSSDEDMESDASFEMPKRSRPTRKQQREKKKQRRKKQQLADIARKAASQKDVPQTAATQTSTDQTSTNRSSTNKSYTNRASTTRNAAGGAAATGPVPLGTASLGITTLGTATLRTAATRKAAPRKDAAGKSAPKKTRQPKVKNTKASYGSGQHLQSELFATRAYREYNALIPPNPPLRNPKPTEESRRAQGTPPEASSNPIEIRDLVSILSDLSPYTEQGYFETLKDIASIDKMIIIGLKVSSKGEGDDEDDGDAEAPSSRPKPRGTSTKLLSYTGLNTNLPPLSNIHDIFADLTQRALGEGLSDFLEAMGSKVIKVATLCSGTESPLLALQMVQESEYLVS
jgi:hypothetical protein